MKLSLASSLAFMAVVSALPTGNKLHEIIDEITSINPVRNSSAGYNFTSWPKPVVHSQKLQESITAEALKEKAEALQQIAESSIKEYGHPTRVIGSDGHRNTVDYIVSELQLMSNYYTFELHKFEVFVDRVKSSSLLIDGVEPELLKAIRLTPSTPHGKPVHARLVLAGNSGCELSDYPANITAGNIVLVSGGHKCSIGDKSINAGKSGAVGLIVFDDSTFEDERLNNLTGDEVPTVGITFIDAMKFFRALKKNPTEIFEVTLHVDSFAGNIDTWNVIAETRGGDHENVVSLGAHSDSVAEGPGINDDGSGIISLLEVAKQLTNYEVNNAVRFAWWAAEEQGLLGSIAYANSLSPEENQKVRLYMNHDMVASRNYEYQVYDANNEDHPKGSGDLKNLYVDWYELQGLSYTLIPFDGRSDYVSFIDVGIPAGGITSGMDGFKTEESQERFGGEADKWFDPCYHQLCDDLSNLDYPAWVINTKLIAHSVATYAKSLGNFPVRDAAVLATSTGSKFSDRFKFREEIVLL